MNDEVRTATTKPRSPDHPASLGDSVISSTRSNSAFYARLSATYGTDVDLEAAIRESRRAHPGAEALIFLVTHVVSETLRKAPDPAVIAWLVRHDAELALPTVAIAEIAFGIAKVRPHHRAARLEQGLA